MVVEEERRFIVYGTNNGLWVIQDTNVDDAAILKEAQAKLDEVNRYITLYKQTIEKAAAALKNKSDHKQAYWWIIDCRQFSEQIKNQELAIAGAPLVSGWQQGNSTLTETAIIASHNKRLEVLAELEKLSARDASPSVRISKKGSLHELAGFHFIFYHISVTKNDLQRRLQEEGLPIVSRFIDRTIAEEAVAEYIDTYDAHIISLLATKKVDYYFPGPLLEFSLPIGYFMKSGNIIEEAGYKLQLILRKIQIVNQQGELEDDYTIRTAKIYH